MPWVAGGLGLLGGLVSYKGATDAADAASGSMDAATALQRDIYEQSRQDLDPYMAAGEAGMEGYMTRLGYDATYTDPWMTDDALKIGEQFLADELAREGPGHLDNLAVQLGKEDHTQLTAEDISRWMYSGANMGQGWEQRWGDAQMQIRDMVEQVDWGIPEGETIGQFGLEDLVLDPGYQFTLSEGTRAKGFGSSASGMTLSGAALKDMNRYVQDYSTTKFDEAFNRNQLELENLFNVGSLGQASAVGAAQSGAQFGQTMAGLQTDQAMIAASGAAAPYNAISAGINTGLAGYNIFNKPGSAGTISPPPLDDSYKGDPINLTIG